LGRGFVFNGNVYIVLVTISIFMATQSVERNDTAVRVSKWLDKEIEGYISDRKVRVEFPSKRNFVDKAVMAFLEKRGVELNG